MAIEHIDAEGTEDPNAPMKLSVKGPRQCLTPVKAFLDETYQIKTEIKDLGNEYELTGDVPQPLAKEVTAILYKTYV